MHTHIHTYIHTYIHTQGTRGAKRRRGRPEGAADLRPRAKRNTVIHARTSPIHMLDPFKQLEKESLYVIPALDDAFGGMCVFDVYACMYEPCTHA